MSAKFPRGGGANPFSAIRLIIASLKSEIMGKLINRIPGSRLLISSSPCSALRTFVESLGKPRDVNKCSQSLAW